MSITCYDKLNKCEYSFSIHEIPDYCPYCHRHIKPYYIDSYVIDIQPSRSSAGAVCSIFQCTNSGCQSIIQVNYSVTAIHSGQYVTNRSWLVGGTFSRKVFSENITSISPNFEIIYNQASEAEFKDLDEIAGIGYRKSLEFLIKDYAIKLDPANEETIKSQTLQNVINNWIASDNVKRVAARAAWLGNDEAHYIRKWEEYDINHLKKLIDLTVHWIEMEEDTRQVLDAMPEGRR